jgi:hypothetical protein
VSPELLDWLLPGGAGAGLLALAGWLARALGRWARRILTELETQIADLGEVARQTREVDERLQGLLTGAAEIAGRTAQALTEIEQSRARIAAIARGEPPAAMTPTAAEGQP